MINKKTKEEVTHIPASKKPVNLYVAILNKGWIRRELYDIVDEIRATPKVTTKVEPFSMTFAEPIFANRNRIAKRFLAAKPKQDFLMMIDNDVLPLSNPAEVVFADKDIIGLPAKVRQRGRILNWVAYVKHPTVEGYFAVDFDAVDDEIDLLKVDIVGTGCIVIKRRVIETLFKKSKSGLDAPFTIEISDIGDSKYGTDFAFCRRAGAAGFEIFTTPQRVCEHVKEIGLLDIQGYDDSDGRDTVAGKYAIPWGVNAISQSDWYFIQRILEKKKIKTVLEFGAGLSTLLMSEMAEVLSFETDVEYGKNIIKLSNNGHKDRRLAVAEWDGKKIDTELSKYDLAFIDGPPGKDIGGVGREASFRIAVKHADKIIVHDAGRQDEQRLQGKYMRGKFKLISKNGWHQARCHYWEKRNG